MLGNKKKEGANAAETNTSTETPHGLPPLDEILSAIRGNKKPMTLSERIVKLAKERDFIFDRINEWDEDIAAQKQKGETDAIVAPISDVREAMVAYKNALSTAIKDLLELT